MQAARTKNDLEQHHSEKDTTNEEEKPSITASGRI
jgi:hypothetical protein